MKRSQVLLVVLVDYEFIICDKIHNFLCLIGLHSSEEVSGNFPTVKRRLCEYIFLHNLARVQVHLLQHADAIKDNEAEVMDQLSFTIFNHHILDLLDVLLR